MGIREKLSVFGDDYDTPDGSCKMCIRDRRIPAFIVVIASFVTLLQMIMQAYVPALYATLGLFIPLIVVNLSLIHI